MRTVPLPNHARARARARARTHTRAGAIVLALALAAASLSPGCSSPGGAGKDARRKRTILVTEYDDARVGREASRDIAAEMGVLDDPALTAYVREIGRKLLRGIPNRSFQYQFSIVDQFEPNAFALPGGYVFVSRGMLALANSEDELANVIGHEITHAHRRHAAAQQALAQRGNPIAMPWIRAAHLAAYGRDMERDADRGGQMLAAAAGYDPMGMSTFLNDLGQMERLLIGHSRLPTFLDTHPGSRERAAMNAARAREIRWKRDPSLGDTHVAHLRRIDGIALGQRPEGGIVDGTRFLHPDLDFQLSFPQGWEVVNAHTAVGATSPRGDAVVFLTADGPAGDPREFANAFAGKLREEYKLRVKKSQAVRIGRIEAWRLELEGGAGATRVAAHMTFVPYRGVMYRITGATPASVAKQYLGRTRNTVRSFRPLTDEERRSIRATRLRLVTALPGEDLAGLGRRTGNAWDPSRTAVLNGLFATHRFEGGELVKVARTEPYVPRDAGPDGSDSATP